jgi:hypothetical protein
MLKKNHFQYDRINEELKQYGTKFTVVSLVNTEDKEIQLQSYGFRHKEELYHIFKNLTGKYTICKIKNKKIYGTYAGDLSFKELKIALRNLLED